VSNRKHLRYHHPHSFGVSTRSVLPRGRLTNSYLARAERIGYSDQSARNISPLGTTEKRIVFSPVEIRNPSSSPTSGRTSKGETPGKESTSASKKGKKKVNFWANGIEDVVGSLSAGVSKPSAVDEQNVVAESDPSPRSKAAGKKREATQDDENDDMYATEEEDVGEEAKGDGTFDVDPPLQEKREPSRSNGEGSGNRSIQTTTSAIPLTLTPPAAVNEPNIAQGQFQHEVPPTGSGDIIMAIDPALEALHVPGNEPSPGSSGTGI
jgi:hypothetical protein